MNIKEELKWIKQRISEIESSLDDSQTKLTAEWWDGFKIAFFKPYGGLPVCHGSHVSYLHATKLDLSTTTLRESPPYPWSGGECPVPDSCEVEFSYPYNEVDADGIEWNVVTCSADVAPWDIKGQFRLTGVVHDGS